MPFTVGVEHSEEDSDVAFLPYCSAGRLSSHDPLKTEMSFYFPKCLLQEFSFCNQMVRMLLFHLSWRCLLLCIQCIIDPEKYCLCFKFAKQRRKWMIARKKFVDTRKDSSTTLLWKERIDGVLMENVADAWKSVEVFVTKTPLSEKVGSCANSRMRSWGATEEYEQLEFASYASSIVRFCRKFVF